MVLPADPGGSSEPPTMYDFFNDVLHGLGIRATDANLRAMYAWAQAEGGDLKNAAHWNPLNTTQGMTGASSINSVGVKAYRSYSDGVDATIRTLANGRYGNLLYALRTSNDPVRIAQAIGSSPWGTSGSLVTQIASKGGVYSLGFGAMYLRGTGGTVGTSSTMASNPAPLTSTGFSTHYQGAGGVSAGSGSRSGSSGGGGGGVSEGFGGFTNMPEFDQKEFEAGLASMGFAAAFLRSDKELNRIFKQAIQGHWNETKFENAIKSSNWWQKRSSSQRAYDEERYADPKNWERKNQVTAANLIHTAAAMGFTLSQGRANFLAQSVNRNGFSPDETQNLLASEIHYNPKANYGGTMAQAMTQIKKLGEDYNVNLTDSTVGGWAQKIVSGNATVEQYGEYIKKQALSKYPWLKDQIDAGLTVADIASPFKAEMGRILEVDPESIKTDDPSVLRGLQYRDPADQKGSYTTMPLYQYQRMLRQDPRWLKTNNARDQVMDIGTSVLRDFGLS